MTRGKLCTRGCGVTHEVIEIVEVAFPLPEHAGRERIALWRSALLTCPKLLDRIYQARSLRRRKEASP